MGAAEITLAKLTRPRVGNMLARERLFASLDRLRDRAVVWIAAEPGAGKTTLLASYLESRRMPGIWYQVDEGDADPASFFYHLGLAAEALRRPKAAEALPIFTADQDLGAFSRRYFRALYQRMGKKSALVLDNLHDVAESTPLHRVLATAFEETPDGVTSLVGSRLGPPAAYTELMARERLAVMDPADIRLTLEESGEIIEGRANVDASVVRRLHEQAGGWAAGLTLLVERARRGEAIDDRESGGALQPVFSFFADQLIARDFPEDTDALLALSYLPRATAEVANALTGSPRAGALLETLHRRHIFTQRRMVGGKPSYELHALLRAYLQRRVEAGWSLETRHAVMERAATLLEQYGELEGALDLFRRIEDWAAVARVVLKAAQMLMAQERRLTLRDWLLSVPEPVRAAQPRLLYWLGCALTQDNARAARIELERAHAGFVQAGDPLGRMLACAGILYTYYLDLAELQGMDPWIGELIEMDEARIRFPTPTIELHVRASLLFALCFRHPDADLIRANASRMFALLEDTTIAANERVASATLLVFHCYHHAENEDGLRLARMMEPLVGRTRPGIQALWWIQMGYLRMTAGDIRGGIEAFETSVRIAGENALSIPILDVYVQMGLGMAAVLSSDLARADIHRQRAERHWKSFRLVDVAAKAMLQGLCASHRGEYELAAGFARRHEEVAEQAGIQWQAHNAMLHRAYVAYHLGRSAEGAECTRGARAKVAGTVFERFHYQSDLLDAYDRLVAGDHEAMRARLAKGLASGRVDPVKFFLRLQPHVLPRLFAAALREDIEADAVRHDIRSLGIPPPDPYIEEWPWPLAVRTLGRFEVRRHGEPLAFSRKAPRKTLMLLKAIIALGGANVREQALLDALWGDEEGDAAAKSLGAAVLRLRTLLGEAEAVVQQGGTLSLDRTRVWVDAWAFEHAGRLELYGGSFLAEDEGEPWAVPLREKLRARYVHQVGEHGQALERAGRHAEAIEWYLRGLDADMIVEPFYQGLMRCYLALDRRAEAVAAYRRARQTLSVTLGLAPSAATERLQRQALKAESVADK